jgi:hypothetical protein
LEIFNMSSILRQLEQQNRLPPGLLGAVMMAESSGNPRAISPKGAQGLFQFMPATAKQYGIDPLSPLQSAQGAAQMLGELNQKYGGSLPHVLGAYNFGQGNIDRKGLQAAPAETRNYIDKILNSLSPISTAAADEIPAIPTREEFLRMKQAGEIGGASQQGQIQQVQQEAPQPSNRVPTRAEFLQMKRMGIAPRPEEAFTVSGMQVNDMAQNQVAQPSGRIPTRAEFLAMKQAGQVPSIDQPEQSNEDSSFGADALDFIKNAGLGFAARGNEAMAAMNPWSDKDKIAREQEWVKQHTGAGLGTALADMAMLSPLAAISGGAPLLDAAARALGSGIIEAGTKPGDLSKKAENTALGFAGGLLGEGLGAGIKLVNKPFKNALSSAQQALVGKAQALNIPLSAADRSGSKALGLAQDALESLPFSSSMEANQRELQRKAWTQALMQEVGENADNASPQVMGSIKNRLSSVYDDIAGRNVINMDDTLKAELKQVNDKLLSRLPTNQKPIVKSYLKDFAKAGKIPASTYQNTRSMLDRQARSFANSDPATAQALFSIRDAMDGAFQRSVSPNDYAALMDANRQWGIMRTLEKSIDPLSGEISPKKFLTELNRRNKNSVLFGKGEQSLNDLARIGAEFLSSKLPSSGTAERATWQNLMSLKNPLPYLAGGGFYGYLPATIAGLAVPPLASKAMWSPGRYLSQGLIDMNKQLMPGLTRGGLLDLMALELGQESVR